jgi:hypothetical protein
VLTVNKKNFHNSVYVPNPNKQILSLSLNIYRITIRLIKKLSYEKIKYILKLYYVINHIIFDFFITLIILIKQICKS